MNNIITDAIVVGKYAEHKDAYKSIYEALDHAGIHNRAQVRIVPIQSELVEHEGPERLLSGFDGILIPGGFGERGIEGKVRSIRFAREREIPFFGICLGMQTACIEFGRNVVNLENAHSTEFDKNTPHPVICLLDEGFHRPALVVSVLLFEPAADFSVEFGVTEWIEHLVDVKYIEQ